MFLRFAGGGGGGGGGVNGGGGGVGGGIKLLVRYFSKKRAENVRKTNPKVPIPEASAISMNLYQVIKQHGPLTIPNTWTQAQEAGVSGLQSKTHMKIMLKWMRGRKMLKLICNQVGSNKKFFVSTLPDEPDSGKPDDDALAPQTKKPRMKKKKLIKQGKVKKQIKPGMLGKHRQY